MTVETATEKELSRIAASPHKALLAAYEMLCHIQDGHNFDTADYLRRKSAVCAALDSIPDPIS